MILLKRRHATDFWPHAYSRSRNGGRASKTSHVSPRVRRRVAGAVGWSRVHAGAVLIHCRAARRERRRPESGAHPWPSSAHARARSVSGQVAGGVHGDRLGCFLQRLASQADMPGLGDDPVLLHLAPLDLVLGLVQVEPSQVLGEVSHGSRLRS